MPNYVRTHESVWNENRVELSWALAGDDQDLDFVIARRAADEPEYATIATGGVESRDGSFVFADETVEPATDYSYFVEVLQGDRVIASFTTQVSTPEIRFALQRNFPNPFNPNTTIRFAVPERTPVRLTIYDVAGRQVRALVDEQRRAGIYSEVWDGRDDAGRPAISGTYVYKLQTADRIASHKMMLLK